MFMLTKEYKLTSMETVHGKWPEQLGNGFFVESEYLIDDFLEMTHDAIYRYYKNNTNAV